MNAVNLLHFLKQNMQVKGELTSVSFSWEKNLCIDNYRNNNYSL